MYGPTKRHPIQIQNSLMLGPAMSHMHKAFLSSLLVASLAVPASAQTPVDSAVTPPADSAAPAAKKSRFGGLMNKAKAVAGNKAVQGAVKGAATNVACNAVPGAAVAAAATGNTTCQNTLMGGLINKGVAGTAAAMAGGVASGAASDAASKLTGVKGAAAAGAIGAVTGGNVSAGGLKGAAAAMAGSKVNGLGQAAAAAAAAKMMGKGGGGAATGAANAASMAAAQAAAARMMPNGGALPNGAAPSAADMAAAMAAMNAMGGAMTAGATGGKKVEVVDFRELKGMLPASLGGLKRTDATGEKSGAMGMVISTAEGRYSSDDGKSISVKIGDIGSLSGMAGMAAYAWATHEVDRESDTEYEKTTTFKGYKALEKYNKQTKSGDMSVLVGGRFVVEAEGSNVSMDALKAAIAGVDLRKLDGMKGKGVK